MNATKSGPYPYLQVSPAGSKSGSLGEDGLNTVDHNRLEKYKKKGLLNVGVARGGWSYLAGIGALALVLIVNVATSGRQAPWEDEIFGVSTGWSLARSHPPILSVLAQYPHTGSPIPFYGPVSFEAEAWLIRAFGLSLIVWRLACLSGVLLTLFACWELVRLAGGDKWAQLVTALMIALSSSVSGPFPGRWDAVTTGLFLSGLLVMLRAIEVDIKGLLLRSASAGVLVGFALASTPRTLTLSLAAAVAGVVTCLSSSRLRKPLFLGLICIFSTALLTHTLLILPWGQNSISWYSQMRRATRSDYINATPLTGRGLWTLDLQHHKILAFPLLLLIVVSALSAITERSRLDPEKAPIKLFLTAFGSVNLILMLLLLANALGQTAFWLPPAIVATMCWISWDFFRSGGKGLIAGSLACACLLFLCLEEAEQTAAVVLTWNQRSTAALTAFVRKTIPAGASVYGPIGGYFYPVELSKDQYLYPYERTTPGLYSQPLASVANIAGKLDELICSHRTYAMWPKPDPAHHPMEQPMPEALRERLREPVAEFDQPSLPLWKDRLLGEMGDIGGKYGFPDVVIYSLRSQSCDKN